VAWVRNEAIPELGRLADEEQYWPAFLLARRIEEAVPGDTMLQKLRARFAGEFRRAVVPAGAKVFARRQNSGEAEWVELRATSGGPLLAPRGYSVFRVENPGFAPREFAMTVHEFPWESYVLPGSLVLSRTGEDPLDMVRVDPPPESAHFDLDPSTWKFVTEGRVPSFLVDVHEVTNREYKQFVDAGGYRRTEFWTAPFERDGTRISFDEAMNLLHDGTGRPGPVGWEVGSYPAGADDYPVTGVSWYEAAAYAAFVGKRLPSVYHWALASVPSLGGDFVTGSNFSGALAPVSSYRASLNAWGLYDVAGNAHEWCSNASGDQRFAAGGACDTPAYMLWRPEPKPPFERSPTTGFRCIKPVTSEPAAEQLDAAIARAEPIEWDMETPFSDEAWRTWRMLLSYAKAPLEERVEWVDDSLPSWRVEKVSFAAAYANERVVAYLFLPKDVPPPWQAVVFWPGAYAALVSTSQDGRNTLDLSYWDYLVRDGRAVLYPILKGTFERGGHVDRVIETSMHHCILEAKDVFRSIDYLETRTDIQHDRIGYLGFSWGAVAGPFVTAVEPRIKVQVLLGGGLYDREMVGFIHRCSIPTQMVNGRSDGYAENQAPLFRGLATPPDQKHHVVFDSDHSLQGFQNEIVKVNLEWFDRFLGPAR
jgi:dienelactone hydrolase